MKDVQKQLEEREDANYVIQTSTFRLKRSSLRDWHWKRFQITPGISNDQRLTGIEVPLSLVQELRSLCRAQVEAIGSLREKL